MKRDDILSGIKAYMSGDNVDVYLSGAVLVYSVKCVSSTAIKLGPYNTSDYDLTLSKKGNSPYSITKRRVPELIPVLGSQPAGDVSYKPGGRLPLLSARPALMLPSQALRGLLPISLLGEQRHNGCEQFA